MTLIDSSEIRLPRGVRVRTGLLPLQVGETPQTIYVTAAISNGARVAAFAAQRSGPFYFEGFSWPGDPNDPAAAGVSLRVVFKLLDGIASVSCADLPDSGTGTQETAIPATETEYELNVKLATGDVQPQRIRVAPVNNPPTTPPVTNPSGGG